MPQENGNGELYLADIRRRRGVQLKCDASKEESRKAAIIEFSNSRHPLAQIPEVANDLDMISDVECDLVLFWLSKMVALTDNLQYQRIISEVRELETEARVLKEDEDSTNEELAEAADLQAQADRLRRKVKRQRRNLIFATKHVLAEILTKGGIEAATKDELRSWQKMTRMEQAAWNGPTLFELFYQIQDSDLNELKGNVWPQMILALRVLRLEFMQTRSERTLGQKIKETFSFIWKSLLSPRKTNRRFHEF